MIPCSAFASATDIHIIMSCSNFELSSLVALLFNIYKEQQSTSTEVATYQGTQTATLPYLSYFGALPPPPPNILLA